MEKREKKRKNRKERKKKREKSKRYVFELQTIVFWVFSLISKVFHGD